EVTFALDGDAPGPRWVEARTVGGPRDRALGDPSRTELTDDVQAVAPDLREIEAWRVLPEQPLRFAVHDGEQVRLALRRPLPARARTGLGVPVAAEPCTAVLSAVASDGTPLDSWSV